MDKWYRIQCWSHLSLALAGHCSLQIWLLTKCLFRVKDLSRCCKYRGLIWLKCDIYIKFEMLLRKILFREIQRRAYFCAIIVTHSFLLFNILWDIYCYLLLSLLHKGWIRPPISIKWALVTIPETREASRYILSPVVRENGSWKEVAALVAPVIQVIKKNTRIFWTCIGRVVSHCLRLDYHWSRAYTSSWELVKI